MSNSVRVNKVLRKLNISLEEFIDATGLELRSTVKIGIIKKEESINDLSIEELIDLKDNIHRILLERIDSLKKKIEKPELYAMQE